MNIFCGGGVETELLLYVLPDDVAGGNLPVLMEYLSQYEDRECHVTVQEGTDAPDDAFPYFAGADWFVTTRAKQTVQWIGYAYRCRLKILHGTDIPVFGDGAPMQRA